MRKIRTLKIHLPCHPDTEPTLITGRRSKQLERPRNHSCPTCGRLYRVDASRKPPVVIPR